MHDQSTFLLPLHNRAGLVVAIATIDAEDASWVLRHNWCLNRQGRYGYPVRGISRDGKRRMVFLHREILGITWRVDVFGDHINHDTLDNRRANLRVVTKGQNLQNRAGATVASQSGLRGVTFHPSSGKWRARVKVARTTHSFGLWVTKEEAAIAAAKGRAQLMTHATG